MKHWLISVALAGAALTAMALPTVEAVQAEVQKGNYAQAESMMQEVVTAKPTSARAQYVLAEVMAHNKHLEGAERALQKAKELDPSTQFTTPEKLKTFEQALEKARRASSAAAQSVPATTAATTTTTSRPATVDSAPASRDSGLPTWVWGLGGAAVALVLWRTLGARRNAAPAGGMMSSSAAAPGFGQSPAYGGAGAPGYGMNTGAGYGMPPARGNGMLGTGLAVAGGLAAGMMAERLLHGDSGSSGSGHSPANDSAGNSNSGGLVPGMFDNDSAQNDLQNQAVDFGSGDGWGGGDAGGDAGGGGDDGW